MKIKITPLNNHWFISQKKDNEYYQVGKIIPQPYNVTLFFLENNKASLITKRINNNLIEKFTFENYSLICRKYSFSNQMIPLEWETESKQKFLICKKKKSHYMLYRANTRIAKLTINSSVYIFEILKETNIPIILLLASVFPILRESHI